MCCQCSIIRIFEGYGTTEASPILSLNTPLLNKKGSVGCLLPGIEYKLEPVEGIESGGNLLVRGANIMKGYLIHGEGFKPLKDWYRIGPVTLLKLMTKGLSLLNRDLSALPK